MLFFTANLEVLSVMFGRKKKRPEISGPSNFEHRVHTGYDNVQGAFVGLPTQWASIVEPVQRARPRPLVDPSSITPVKVSLVMLIVLIN